MAGGYKLWSTGEVVTATNLQNYIQNQTVMVFASAAARTTALSGVVAEGMLSYRTDSHILEYYTGSAWSAVSTPTSLNLTFNAQTGTTYTLASGDVNYMVTASNASAITVTVPPSIFTTGQQVHLQQIAAGQVTFAQGSGVTITSTGATASAPKTRTQYSACTIICTGTNTFTIVGDIS
jgi:hypothetical protein